MQTEINNLKCGGRRCSILECLILISILILMASGKPPGALHDSKGMERNAFRMGSDNNVGSNNESDVCVSVQCYSAATKTLSKIKWEIEPCDDFYQFACGKFVDEVVIPNDKVKMNTFSMISDKVAEQLKRIIAEERRPTDPKHLRFPNILYKACMNTNLEDLGAAPIKEISDTVGGWPLIKGEAWDSEDKWSWQDTAKKLRKLGFLKEGIFTTSLNVDWRNNKVWILSIDEPGLDLDREFLVKGFSGKRVRHYYDYMVDIAVLFGADKEEAKKELRTVMEFEICLANISTTFTDNSSSDIMDVHSIKQLQELHPYVQWLDYINALLPEGLLVNENEPINVMIPNFLDSLGILLAKTPKRVIANYMLWQMHDFAVPFLSEEFRNREQQYRTLTSGVQSREPRWKECVDITSASFGISVGSLYVQEYFRGDSKAITLEMVNTIRSAFGDILNEVAWMDDITKQYAMKKLHSMVAHVGYPDELLDDRKLEEYYRKLEIDPVKYFESLLKVNIFNIENIFNKLRVPVKKLDWKLHSMTTTVNAFYSSTENSLIIPAAILQGNFFNANLPMYMNYGGIGVTIGHEITHGFDDEGQKYDRNGNLDDWWQSDTQKAFQDRVNCIREQYGNYIDRETGLKLNAENTQADNIADNGGVMAAYTAYRKWVAANGPEAKIIGLDFTPEQMFWISAGQTWCAKYRKESLKTRITTGVHSPSEFRVLGSFSNMKDFSKDFQCPEGSPMNPVHKCEIW